LMNTKVAKVSRTLAKVKCGIRPERHERFVSLAESAASYRLLHAISIKEGLYESANAMNEAAATMGIA